MLLRTVLLLVSVVLALAIAEEISKGSTTESIPANLQDGSIGKDEAKLLLHSDAAFVPSTTEERQITSKEINLRKNDAKLLLQSDSDSIDGDTDEDSQFLDALSEPQVVTTYASIMEYKTLTVAVTPAPTPIGERVYNARNMQKVNPQKEGWVLFTPGIKKDASDEAKIAITTTIRDRNIFYREDALPGAIAVINEIYNLKGDCDKPAANNIDIVYVTQTQYRTTKMLTGTPMPTGTVFQKRAQLLALAESRMAARKAKGVTVTTTIIQGGRPKVNTHFLIGDSTFTILPDDVFKGVHAKNAAHAVTTSIALSVLSILVLLLII